MGIFSSNYNEEQKKAVTYGNGPLFVISGAGTGKTNLLVGRILHLIAEKGVDASNILALTFTEKATQEMNDRVNEALPLGYHEIWIKTFHSFCESILRESGLEIGLQLDFKILNEADLWMFMKNHLVDFGLDYYRPLGNPYKFLNALQQHFSRLQDENISPETYLNFAKKSKEETAVKELELARTYGIYQKLLVENGYMDFGGLLFYTLLLFQKRPSVLNYYSERFKYILVDEFQDTNFAQNKIVTLLAQEHRNLLVVGDDDQSIYRWRGASLTNIQYFKKLFPEAKTLVLNKNYRSNQAILDLAYSVIKNNNPRRLEVTESVDKKLISVKPGLSKPEIHHFPAFTDEIDFILNKAQTFINQELDTAILVRTNALANFFVERMRSRGLPYQHFSGVDLFNKKGIKDCMALLRVVNDPWDDIALFRLLSLPIWNIQMEELLKIVRQTKFGNKSLFELIDAKQFAATKKLIASLIEYSRNHTVSEVIKKFLDESGYLKDDIEHVQDIALLAEKIKDFEAVNENKSVKDFLVYAQMIEESGSRNTFEAALDPSILKILTIHSAKGLEFDAVFIPGLVQSKFPSISRKDFFDIPSKLIEESIPEGNHHLEEERRLFYVACTRARQNLILTYSDFYDGKKQWKPSVFIGESEKNAILKNPKKKTGSQEEFPLLDLAPRKHRPLLNINKISYSQLDTFKTCPLKYQLRYLFQIPAPSPAVLNFGSTIHNTLRDFYLELQKNPDLVRKKLPLFLKETYEKNWIPHGYETLAMQKDQKKRGWKLLEKFYAHEMKDLVIPEFLERQFVFKIGPLTLTGRIDRIDKLKDGTYEIIDYKTGSNTRDSARDLQLSLYALACKEVFKIPVSKLSLYFLDGLDGPEKISTERTAKDLEKCKEEILKYASEISGSDFSPTPGFHCNFCEFRLLCPVTASIKNF